MIHHRRVPLGIAAVAMFLWIEQYAATANAQPPAAPPPMVPSDGAQNAYGNAPIYSPIQVPPGPGNAVNPPPPDVPMKPFSAAAEDWDWRVLPPGVIWKSYMAGGKESRISSQWVYDKYQGWLWDATLGGRASLLRYGTAGSEAPEGFEVQVEGAAFPRLNAAREVISTDFRAGCPLVYRQGAWETKLAYQHECSHLGDFTYVLDPGAQRINFVRDEFVLAEAYHPIPAVRVYAEAGWAFHIDGGAEPWEFQFGIDFSPVEYTGVRGAPFAAINGRIREELDFGGSVQAEAGWQWRGEYGQLFRLGVIYFNGKSDQYQFYKDFENMVGAGLWYDY
jgi:hypothetical protein